MSLLARLLCACAVLPAAASGARLWGPDAKAKPQDAKQKPQEREVGVQHLESYGVPKLEALKTSNDTEAAAFLAEWSAEKDFGLFLQLVPDNRGFFPSRVGLLGISRGTRVLLFDLKPHLRKNPMPGCESAVHSSMSHKACASSSCFSSQVYTNL